MPLVTNDGVNIPFTADADDLVAESKRVISELEKVKQAVKQKGDEVRRQAQQEDDAIRKNSMSWTDFRSMYQTVLDVVRVGQQVWTETGQKFEDFAIEAGNAARSLGTTTEEASRLIQISDDVGISFESLRTSMKQAQKDGFSPTVEGLARMSDEYLKLAPGVERTQFLLDRFGKSGDEMGKLLEKGSASIRSMSAAMNENLIITQKDYEAAEKYRIAVDNLNDAWDGVTMQIGKKAVPAMTDLLTVMKDNIEEGYTWKSLLNAIPLYAVINKVKELKEAHEENAAATVATTEASVDATGAFESEADRAKRLAEETKLAEQAIKDMSKANQEFIGIVGKLTNEQDKNAEAVAKIQAELDAGNITIQEAQMQWQKLADEQEKSSRRMILSMLEQQLAIDGLDETETNYLLSKGLEWGVYSESAVNAARAAIAEVNSLKASLNSLPTNKTITITQITNAVNNVYTNSYGQQMNFSGRAAGGPVMAGNTYSFNERSMNTGEAFVPAQKGTVVPQDQATFDYKKLARAIRDGMSQAGA